MSRIHLPVLLFAIAAAACADQPTAPSSAPARSDRPSLSTTAQGVGVHGSESYPYAITFEVPCARGGAGDVVQASGEIEFRWHIAMLANGNWNEGDISVAHHGQAVSLIDGTVYQAPLTNRVTNNLSAGQNVGSNTLTYRFVGPGPSNDLVVSSLSVWNFDGADVHVWFSDYTITCGTDGSNVPGSNQPADPIHAWPTE